MDGHASLYPYKAMNKCYPPLHGLQGFLLHHLVKFLLND